MSQDSSTDLFASLAGMMIIIVAVLMTAVNVKEQLISIENRSAPTHQVQVSPDKQQLGLLEIAYQEHGKPLFYWTPTDHSKKQVFQNYSDIRKAIEASRPDGIRLRLDDRVPSGVFKRLLTDASNLNIAIYQSEQQELSHASIHDEEPNKTDRQRFAISHPVSGNAFVVQPVFT